MSEDTRYRSAVALSDICASPTNPRKHFAEPELQSLADDIKKRGVISPIVIRLNPDSTAGATMYELISGERRWRASRLAGKSSIPAMIRDDLSQPDIIAIQLIENLQREDLHPLEEATGYRRMIDDCKYSADQLAEEIGKSRSYIFSTLKLLDLCEDGQRLFSSGLLNRSSALLVARIPTQKLQLKAIEEITDKDYNGDSKSVRQAQRWIKDRYMLALEKAPFPTSDTTLVPLAGGCATCTKCTGNARELFDDIDSPDVCTDPDCYTAKKIAHRDREAEKVTQAGGKVILGDDAKRIAPYGTNSCTLKGYTKLEDKCYDDPAHRTYAEILGEDAEACLLEDYRSNTLAPVLPNKVLAEKLQAAGVKLRAEEDKKGAARAEAKLTLERKTRERVFQQVRTAWKEMAELPQAILPFKEMSIFLKMITLLVWDRMYSDNKPKLTLLWGAHGKNQTEREADFVAKLPNLTATECWQLLVDILTIGGQTVTSEWDLTHGAKRLMEVAGIFGIDPEDARLSVMAEAKSAESAEKPKKTSKKTPAATLADAFYPSKAAQAADQLREEEPGAATEAAPAGDETAPEEAKAEEQSCAAVAAVEKQSEAGVVFVIGDRVIFKPSHHRAGQEGVIKTDWNDGWLVDIGERRVAVLCHEIEKAPSPDGAAIEMDAKPSEASGLSPKVGEVIATRSTAKNWKVANQLALVLSTPKADRATYIVKYGAGAGDMAEIQQEDIKEIVGYSVLDWMNPPADSAAPLSIGDRVLVKADAKGASGQLRKCAGKEGDIEAIRGQAFAVRFAPGRSGVVADLRAEDLIRIKPTIHFIGCTGDADFLPDQAKGKRYTAFEVMYQHPENKELCWSGRGRKPKWVEHWLATAGHTLEQLLPADKFKLASYTDKDLQTQGEAA